MTRPSIWVECDEYPGFRPGTYEEWMAARHAGLHTVAYTEVTGGCVSTCFLFLDAGFDLDPNAWPVLYETMVFGGPHDGRQERYHTREEALAGHARVVEMASA